MPQVSSGPADSLDVGGILDEGLAYGVEPLAGGELDIAGHIGKELKAAGGEAAAPVSRMSKTAMERGLYLFVHWNVVMIAPPLNITREELDEQIVGWMDEWLMGKKNGAYATEAQR